MGLLQQAALTYDHFAYLAGMEQEGKETLAPVGHLITNAAIEVTIDKDGRFVSAQRADRKIAIPVSEESAGRTSAPAPHPLCEQIGYLCGKTPEKLHLYLDGLEDWEGSAYSHPKLTAVLKYVRNGTLLSDLKNAELVKFDEKGNIKNEKDLICWTVIGLDEGSGPVWTDTSLHASYAAYYMQRRGSENCGLCMLSGSETVMAAQHLKGVVSRSGNAKIISANDKTNFTFRGRFTEVDEALTVGYEASQKAHNALKWLVSNEGVMEGNRAFVCWNPNGIRTGSIHLPFVVAKDERLKPTEYRDRLRRTLQGYRETLPDSEKVIIAAFEAATSGRLAVTYYNELSGSDFSERLAYWDDTCCWNDSQWGCSSPLLYSFIRFAFGTQRGGDENARVEVDDRLVGQHMQRLIACRVNRAAFPQDIMRALVQKAGNLQIYSVRNRSGLLFAACAAVRKYHIDLFKEEYSMALEPLRKDRSYQFGRLLAVMEKAERDTYDQGENREPNAIRMQSVFVQKPGYAAKIVMDQLKNGYYPRLKAGQRVYYEKLIGEIMAVISEFPAEEYNRPLSETYLLGYYLQKNVFYTPRETAETEKTEE